MVDLVKAWTENPDAAMKNLMVVTTKGEGFEATAKMGDFEFMSDSPAGLGGQDHGPSPLLVILGVCGQCLIAVTQFWSNKTGVKIDEMRAVVRGQIDLKTLLEVPGNNGVVGFTGIQVRTKIKGPEPDKIKEMMEKVVTHCPIFDLIQGTNCKVEFQHKIK